jgi:hypothetical protein
VSPPSEKEIRQKSKTPIAIPSGGIVDYINEK